MTSLLDLMGVDLPVPDHTTLSRRARTWEPSAGRRQPKEGPLRMCWLIARLKVYGADPWLEDKHAARSRRTWRKLHLALDADSGKIIVHCLTDQDADDPSQVGR